VYCIRRDGVIADFDLGVNKRYKELYPDAELLDLSQGMCSSGLKYLVCFVCSLLL